MKQKDIQLKKDIAELFNIVEKASKPDHCILCGEKNAPICYSPCVGLAVRLCAHDLERTLALSLNACD